MFSKRQLFEVIFLLLLFLSCKGKINETNILTINISHASIKSIHVNDIFDSIEYVILETTPKCLLDENDMDVFVTNKYIITNNKFFKSGVYLFDRKSGKFLYEIGKKGGGPNEYQFIFSHPFNEKFELFYVVKNLQRIGFDINTNKVVEKVFNPILFTDSLFLETNLLVTSIDNIYKMDSTLYIAFPNNRTGYDPYLLIIFDKNGKIVKTFPNHQKYINYLEARNPFNPGLFYEFDNKLYFKEYNFNDTVFQVSIDTITPHIIFNLGKKKPDYNEQENSLKNTDCYWIRYVRETRGYVFFSYYGDNEGYYDGYYDKEKRELVTSLSSSKEMRGFVYAKNQYPPFYIFNINKAEEAVGIITASNMLAYIEKNKHLSYPEKFHQLKYDDNPIIVIAKLK